MKGLHLIAVVVATSCAAGRPEPQTSEVGITVLPVASAAEPVPLARVAGSEPKAADLQPRDPEAAERYFTEGRSAMSAGRVEEACSLFAKSLEADRAVGTLMNIGDCQEKLGNIEAACNAYRDVEAQAQALGQDDRGELARSRAEKLGCR